ncbi:MAG: beta-galactosidase [bacterium]
MARHFRDNRAVIGWQIDNEFGCHDPDMCYCDSCLAEFRKWVENKYKTIDRLNEAWGTVFWSQTYPDFDSVIIPRRPMTSHNPGLLLDYHRFYSDCNIKYQQIQIDILRENCPNHFITHNLMGLFPQIDYFDLAENLDFASWDNYPRHWGEPDPARLALSHDLTRGLKGRPFWVIEEQSGPSGWEIVHSTPRPGEIRLWTYQAIAHGADGIVYFRWRTCRFGTEEFWHGILDHDSIPRRRYYEVKRTGEELSKISEHFEGGESKNAVGMVLSYDNRWALKIQPQNPSFDAERQFLDYYRVLHENNVGVDVVHPGRNLKKYKLIVAPNLYLLNGEIVENLRGFVEGGGIFVVTPRTGVKDWNNTVVDKPLPGDMSDALGVRVDEYDSLPPETPSSIEFSRYGLPSGRFEGRAWCDILEPTTAEVVARYAEDYYRGKPAITANRYGRGLGVYVGTVLEVPGVRALLGWLLEEAGVEPLLGIVGGVEVVRRVKDGRDVYFLLNHSGQERTVFLREEFEDLLTGLAVRGETKIPARDLRILLGK